MNDLEILQRIHEELKTVDHPRFAESMVDFYGHLVERVPEDGFEQTLDDDELNLEQETAVLQLQKYGYLERTMHGIGHGRIEHRINLRGKRFHEVTDGRKKSVTVTMHDSGERQTFETGAVRDTAEGKPRPELISPFATERLSQWLAAGAKKYGDRNWEKGIFSERHCASLCRHLMKFQQGATDEDHLAAIMCNAMFLIHNEEMVKRGVLPENLLNMPRYEPFPQVHKNGDEPYES